MCGVTPLLPYNFMTWSLITNVFTLVPDSVNLTNVTDMNM